MTSLPAVFISESPLAARRASRAVDLDTRLASGLLKMSSSADIVYLYAELGFDLEACRANDCKLCVDL